MHWRLLFSYVLSIKHIDGGLGHMHKLSIDGEVYKKLLSEYIETNNKIFLEQAKEIGSSFASRNVYPEDLFQVHIETVESIFGDVSSEYHKSLEFLLETFLAFKHAREEYERMKLDQLELRSEIQIAANLQQTLLKTDTPIVNGLDIGALSIPYYQLNGDFIHFLDTEDGTLRVAISDVIGKGVPAALAMSMIKYALESFYEEALCPSEVLRKLNRVVEKNVTSNMFITMFYGQYFTADHKFRFASAGHEPGFIYRAKADEFIEIESEGLVLGVEPNVLYEQYETTIDIGDMIVLLTDGVTECRYGDHFITRDEVIEIINQYNHLPAQQHVEQVYMHLNELVDFELKDDFTLIIIKRHV